MPPGPSSGELWGHHLMPQQVEVSFFMPNGMFILMKVWRDTVLKSIKSELWKEARSYPLYGLLKEPRLYIFVGVTQDGGEREEFYDEMRRLCDLRLFQPILKVVEPAGNKDEKIFNSKLNFLIGMTVADFDESNDLELITFRRSSINHCKKVVDDKNAKGFDARALCCYPPNVHSTPHLPTHVMDILKKNQGIVLIAVWFVAASSERFKCTVKVKYDSNTTGVISEAIRKKVKQENVPAENQESEIYSRAKDSILKVCGCVEYLLGDYPVCQFKYIRHRMSIGQLPDLMIVSRRKLYSTLNKSYITMPSYVKKGVEAINSIMHQMTISTWTLEKKKMKMRINAVSYVNFNVREGLFVRAGLYQGTEPLCETVRTGRATTNPKWHEWKEFNISISNLPRSARLCLSLCGSSKKSKKTVEYAMSWCNINLFDFNGRFISGKMSLRMRCVPPGLNDYLNPSGVTGPNPSTDAPIIDIEFEKLCKNSTSVAFPKHQDVLSHAALLEKSHRPKNKFAKSDIVSMQEIISRDPMSDYSEQDKEFLWEMRHYCKGIPNSLPKLLKAVKWSYKDDVAILYNMLTTWHPIRIEAAMELLHCYNTDPNIRQFAVKSLDDLLSDSQLSQYLLQLVQALEYESYMDNSLVRFLLKKALSNEHIGQSLFWYLKASMPHTSKRVYYGLILEAYLRTCGNLPALTKQVEAIEKLTKLSEKLKTEREDTQVKTLRAQLESSDYMEALQNLPSPLDRRFTLGELIIDQCDVKSSKKRPLLLTWKNLDPMADISISEFQIIFKIGDDLRQDMMTLQVFALMDNIWQSEGLDIRVLPYGCLATGLNAGMIEVVRNAKTVLQIFSKDFSSRELHNWIKEKNKPKPPDSKDEEKCPYVRAVEAFTKSCAGYCVATFVLGIGDRHPSNIMVTESGQVFHIDFGHFLDHRKKKFGINRERVPFVLTEDFIRVIAKGQDNPEKSAEFNQFMELCGKAYHCLRKHTNLFITLFTMMLSCGIPELQSLEDVNYVRKTLVVDKSDEEAMTYFQNSFNEAYRGAWTTKIDWFFHWVKNT